MKVYWYQRKDPETGKKAKEWSYRLPPELRALPNSVWPEGFKFNGTRYTSKEASVAEIDLIIQNAKRKALHIEAGVPVVSQNTIEKDVEDYLEWGATQAGKLDEGWSPEHLAHKRTYLKEWIRLLNLESVADITFDAFDRELSRMKKEGLANNTVNNWGHALSGLTKFCKKRNRLAHDPLAAWTSLKKVIRNPRGHYYPEELLRLFTETPEDDAMTYEMAYYTRYREGEIYDLMFESIHWSHGLVELPQAHTKNGRAAFQPLPDTFLPKLWDYVQRRGLKPGDRLLVMSKNHPERRLYKHQERLGIARIRDGKKRDFHALGHSTATNMTILGVSPVTIQKGMRHGSIRQTLDYVNQEALPVRAAVNSLADQLFPHEAAQEPLEDSHYFDTEEDSMNASRAGKTGYRAKGGKPSPSALSTSSSSTQKHSQAQDCNTKSRQKSPSLQERRIGARTPYAEARQILARISHRLSDQSFADLLREIGEATPEKVTQVLSLLKANRKVGAA